MNNLNGFKHINQPDFDRERDGAIIEIKKDMVLHGNTALPSFTETARRAYNEGYKQAVRDWGARWTTDQYRGCVESSVKEIIEEVDKIDKGD